VIGLWLGLAASLFFVGSALLYLWHRRISQATHQLAAAMVPS
jgi:hypothetical protein